MYLSGLHAASAEGGMTFTNATPDSGFLCRKGVAKNTKTGATTESIADCKEIRPFESHVKLAFQFAVSEIRRICPQEGDCDFSTAPAGKP